MAHKQPSLGKGLASLFPGISTDAAATPAATPAAGAGAGETPNRDRHPGISIAAIDDIKTNQFQPRRDFDEQSIEELAASIRSNGIIQPLIVRKDPEGEYELIAGERRLRAAKLAGLKQVPIVIRKSTDREALELALIENIQRQNLNCIDEALAYFQLIQDFSLTQEEVSKRVGKDRATVSNFIRLLRLPEAIIDDLKRGIMSFGHGKALMGLEDNDAKLRARAKIVQNKLSVRDAEALVDQMKKGAADAGAGKSDDAGLPRDEFAERLKTLSQSLTRHWSTKVVLKGTTRRGKIAIHYGSREELERILRGLQSQNTWGAS